MALRYFKWLHHWHVSNQSWILQIQRARILTLCMIGTTCAMVASIYGSSTYAQQDAIQRPNEQQQKNNMQKRMGNKQAN